MRETTSRRRWAAALIALTTSVPLLLGGAATASWAAVAPAATTSDELVADTTTGPTTDASVGSTPDSAPEPQTVAVSDDDAPLVAAVRVPQPASTDDPQSPLSLTVDQPDHDWPWYDAPVTLAVTANSRIASETIIVWSTTGAQVGSGEAVGPSLRLPISATGITTVTISAVDAEGNEAGPTTRTIKVDPTPPVFTLVEPRRTVYRLGESFVVDASCDDPESGMNTCSFTFGDNRARPQGSTVTLDTLGTFEAEVYGSNEAGTFRRSSARLVRVIEDENDAPVVEVDAPPASGGWYSSPFSVTFRGEDGEGSGTVQVAYRETVDGVAGPWRFVDGTQATADVAGDGTHTFEVRATDAFGNVSDLATMSFPVDETAPIVEVALPADGITVEPGDELALDFDCSDALSGVAVCTGTVADGELLDTSELGTFTVSVRARDNAGNETLVERTYTVAEADTTGPWIAFRHVPPTRTGWFHTAPEIELEVTDASAIETFRWAITAPDGSVERYTVPAGQTVYRLGPESFGEGVWDVVVVAIDEFGNESAVGSAIRIDGTAPTVAIESPVNAPASLVAARDAFPQGSTVAFSYTCADTVSGIASCDSSVGGTLPTDQVGTFTAEVVALDEAGHRTVEVLEYTVVAASPVPNGGGSTGGLPTLARTGSDTIWQTALLALGLLVVGGAAAGSVAVVRRGR